MTFDRKTLLNSVTIEGLGLQSGVPVLMTLHPSEHGIAFRYGANRTLAIPANVSDTNRRTKLGDISTIEHIMSALAGTGITDVEIELTAPEVPGVDGSSAPFVALIQTAGSQNIGEKELKDLFTRLYFPSGNQKICVGKGEGRWRYEFEADEKWPGSMHYEISDLAEGYAQEVAPARTTVFGTEIEAVMKLGLGQGLDETSVLILGADGYENQARFPDEPARHKLLDMMGDLYLSGYPPQFLNVTGTRNGHTVNIEMAKMLYEYATR